MQYENLNFNTLKCLLTHPQAKFNTVRKPIQFKTIRVDKMSDSGREKSFNTSDLEFLHLHNSISTLLRW